MSEPKRISVKASQVCQDPSGCPKTVAIGAKLCVAHQAAAIVRMKAEEAKSLGDRESVEQLMGELQTREAPVLTESTDARVPVATVERPATRRPAPVERQSLREAAKPGLDPEVVAAKMAQVALAREAEERLKMYRARQVLRDAKSMEPLRDDELLERGIDPDEERARAARRATFTVTPRRRRRDVTRMGEVQEVDGVAREVDLVPPGHVCRWVREVDHHDRPSQARVEERIDYGWDFVRTQNGEPLRGYLGVAMHADPRDAAELSKDKAVMGTLNRREILDSARDAIEAGNREAGTEVASLYVDKQHKREHLVHYPEARVPDEDDE